MKKIDRYCDRCGSEIKVDEGYRKFFMFRKYKLCKYSPDIEVDRCKSCYDGLMAWMEIKTGDKA